VNQQIRAKKKCMNPTENFEECLAADGDSEKEMRGIRAETWSKIQ
jgi:hypothetical protein